jgi:microcystin-dependent protein
MSNASIYSSSNIIQMRESVNVAGTVNTTNVDLSGNFFINQNLLIPTGTIVQFAGSSAPGGWLLCQGQSVSKTTYSTLWSILGTTYGADTSTNFVLPDLRGRIPLGRGTLNGSGTNYNLADKNGSETHTLTVPELPAHNHTASSDVVGSHTHNYQDAYFAEAGAYTPNGGVYGTSASHDFDNGFYFRTANGSYSSSPSDIPTSSAGLHNHTITVNSTGGGNSFSVVQPYLVVNYLIKW